MICSWSCNADPTRTHRGPTCVVVLGLLLLLCAGEAALATSPDSLTADRLASDLVGHSMGGRERGWKFQSREQIQDLVVDGIDQSEGSFTVEFSCTLQDPRVPGRYEAEAVATYHLADSDWVLWTVGLRSLKKRE